MQADRESFSDQTVSSSSPKRNKMELLTEKKYCEDMLYVTTVLFICKIINITFISLNKSPSVVVKRPDLPPETRKMEPALLTFEFDVRIHLRFLRSKDFPWPIPAFELNLN